MNILGRLPSLGGSHFVEAMRNDPESIQRLLDEFGDDELKIPAWAPRGAEWDQHAELLSKIYDVLMALTAITAAHPLPEGAKRPQVPKPHPRPPREIDAIRHRRRQQQLAEMDDEVEAAKARYRAARERGELPEADN